MQPDRAAESENRDRPTSNTEHPDEVIAIPPAAKHYFSRKRRSSSYSL